MSTYSETKTLRVKYDDHQYTLYVDGSPCSGGAVTIGDKRISVESAVKERVKEIDINVIVDMTPFEESVDNCGQHIGDLTGSVVGFKTASIASKMENEKAIVGKVTSGFSAMIEQDLSMKNAGLGAEIKALANELKQEYESLSKMRDTMESDFNRKKSKYVPLFEKLDKETVKRIKQLNSSCFQFLEQVRKEQNRRVETSLLSMATTGGKESDSARIAIQVARMKQNGARLIKSVRDYVVGNQSLSKVRKAYTVDSDGAATYYAPVVVTSENNGQLSQLKIYSSSFPNGDQEMEYILKDSLSSVGEQEMDAAKKSAIQNYFNQQLAEISDGSQRSQRIIALMSQLLGNSIKTFYI